MKYVKYNQKGNKEIIFPCNEEELRTIHTQQKGFVEKNFDLVKEAKLKKNKSPFFSPNHVRLFVSGKVNAHTQMTKSVDEFLSLLYEIFEGEEFFSEVNSSLSFPDSNQVFGLQKRIISINRKDVNQKNMNPLAVYMYLEVFHIENFQKSFLIDKVLTLVFLWNQKFPSKKLKIDRIQTCNRVRTTRENLLPFLLKKIEPRETKIIEKKYNQVNLGNLKEEEIVACFRVENKNEMTVFYELIDDKAKALLKDSENVDHFYKNLYKSFFTFLNSQLMEKHSQILTDMLENSFYQFFISQLFQEKEYFLLPKIKDMNSLEPKKSHSQIIFLTILLLFYKRKMYKEQTLQEFTKIFFPTDNQIVMNFTWKEYCSVLGSSNSRMREQLHTFIGQFMKNVPVEKIVTQTDENLLLFVPIQRAEYMTSKGKTGKKIKYSYTFVFEPTFFKYLLKEEIRLPISLFDLFLQNLKKNNKKISENVILDFLFLNEQKVTKQPILWQEFFSSTKKQINNIKKESLLFIFYFFVEIGFEMKIQNGQKITNQLQNWKNEIQNSFLLENEIVFFITEQKEEEEKRDQYSLVEFPKQNVGTQTQGKVATQDSKTLQILPPILYKKEPIEDNIA